MPRSACATLLLSALLCLALVTSARSEPLPASVLVLDTGNTNGALNLGGQDTLRVLKGDLVVNATHNMALFNANSKVEVIDGGVKVCGGAYPLGTATITPEAGNTRAVADPYAQTAWPQVDNVASRQKLFIGANRDETLSPGYYTGGLSITGKNTTVHLEPGLYVITDGDVFISEAHVSGEGVTILMSGRTPGKLLIATNAVVELSAPREGALQDLLLVSARTLQGADSDIAVNGGTASLDGVVYAPRGCVSAFFKSSVRVGAIVSWKLMLNTGSTVEVLGERLQPPKEESPRVPMLIAAHNHLQEEVLVPYVGGAVERAREAGVGEMWCNGTDEGDWQAVLDLSLAYAEVVPFFGLHPWFVKDRSPDWLARLEHFLDAVPSGIGEIGLDRHVEDRDEPAQESVFRAQLALAVERGLPVSVHCLKAWGWADDDSRHDMLNVNGSGISLGHPIGATGGRILANLTREMQRRDVKYGLETMCIGGGQGIAAVFEKA